MKTKTHIKKAKVSEIGGFFELFSRSLLDGYFSYSSKSSAFMVEDFSLEELEKGIKKGKRILFLAYLENKVVGYLLTNKQFGGVSFGHWLGVDKDFQKQGIGSKLLSAWERDALKQGAHALEINTFEKDRLFYKKCGFIEAGKAPDFWFGVEHFWFYKPLRKSNEKVFLREYLKKKNFK